MKPQFYGLLYPHIADVARQLGCIGLPVLDVCNFVAKVVEFREPSKTEVENDKASEYLTKLETHIRKKIKKKK